MEGKRGPNHARYDLFDRSAYSVDRMGYHMMNAYENSPAECQLSLSRIQSCVSNLCPRV